MSGLPQSAYLLGPMSNKPFHNRALFREAAGVLRGKGIEVISPVEMDEEEGLEPNEDGSIEPELYFALLRRDFIRILAENPDAGVALPGWQGSNGASGEAALLRSLGKPLYAYPSLARIEEGEQQIRTFETGATRDTDEGKHDYEAYLSPRVLRAFGAYMLKHSIQPDGQSRPSDNWQKGIPKPAYMKSAWRHFADWWALHRGGPVDEGVTIEEAVCALIFNAQGYLHEHLADTD